MHSAKIPLAKAVQWEKQKYTYMKCRYVRDVSGLVLNYELKCFLDHWEFGQTSGTDCCPLV